jgi:ribosomal protein L29
MKFADLKKKSPEDLHKHMQESRETISQLRFELSGGKVKNISQIRALRKEIAQIATLLH